MRKEYTLKNATFVYSKNELGYAPLLEEMGQAKEVTIITYNISERQHQLLDCLKSAPDDCNISIITNIPSRWDEYYGDAFRERAQQKIQVYMTKLAPEELGQKASVYFNFSNHGKIVMTDTSVYIGSSNFSEESAKNIEFGVLTTDADFISFIKQELVPEIISKSISYYEYNYTGLLLEANMLLSALFSAYSDLHEKVYITADDWRMTREYYNDIYDLLTRSSLSRLEDIANDCVAAADEVVDVLYEICGEESAEYGIAFQQFEQLRGIFSEIEALVNDDSITELADFNAESYVHYLLENDYAMEAYEENLEQYISLATDRASSKLHDLCETAQSNLEALLAQSNAFHKLFGEIISLFSEQKLKKISEEIDNT